MSVLLKLTLIKTTTGLDPKCFIFNISLCVYPLYTWCIRYIVNIQVQCCVVQQGTCSYIPIEKLACFISECSSLFKQPITAALSYNHRIR